MTRKLKALAGGMAVAALATAGAVAANAAGSSTVEKVGYFEVQGDENPSPAGWFSEGDDGIADLRRRLAGHGYLRCWVRLASDPLVLCSTLGASCPGLS